MIRFSETIARERCAICGSSPLVEVSRIADTPIYMGATDGDHDMFADLVYAKCNKCKTIQLSELISPDILYKDNHNIDTVGTKWTNHFEQFSQLISSYADVSDVLEVGDPSAKIAARCGHGIWTIVEPNPHPTTAIPSTIRFIRSLIDDVSTGNYSAAVLSHVLEHAIDPVSMLVKIRSLLSDKGRLLVSIPNMRVFADMQQMPPLGMHFEHSFFLDDDRIEYLFAQCGFKVIHKSNYEDHSIFFIAEKSMQVAEMPDGLFDAEGALRSALEKYRQLADKINAEIDPGTTAIMYGAHIMAQLLFALGLNKDKFSMVLDNSPSKCGRRLYGTGFTVHHPMDIAGLQNPQIVCHMGPYTEEISAQLKTINQYSRIL
mgnify:CR=1 FL=1